MFVYSFIRFQLVACWRLCSHECGVWSVRWGLTGPQAQCRVLLNVLYRAWHRVVRRYAEVLHVTLRHLGRHIKVNEGWKDILMCPGCTVSGSTSSSRSCTLSNTPLASSPPSFEMKSSETCAVDSGKKATRSFLMRNIPREQGTMWAQWFVGLVWVFPKLPILLAFQTQ